jgi:hypothetical protein
MRYRVCFAIYSRDLSTCVHAFAVTILGDQFQAEGVETFGAIGVIPSLAEQSCQRGYFQFGM